MGKHALPDANAGIPPAADDIGTRAYKAKAEDTNTGAPGQTGYDKADTAVLSECDSK